MFKKTIVFLLVTSLAVVMLSCGNAGEGTSASADTDANTTADTDATDPAGTDAVENIVPAHPYDCDNVSVSVASELKIAYCKFINAYYGREEFTPSDVVVQEYFGNYSGCEVAFISDPETQYTQAFESVDVAGYTVVFPTSHQLSIYKDGELYLLKDAYEKGLITQKDVYNIGTKVGVGHEDFADRYPAP